jgi:carboxypeptidase C (cathepsin A)
MRMCSYGQGLGAVLWVTMKKKALLAAIGATLFWGSTATGFWQDAKSPAADSKAGEEKKKDEPKLSVTQHEVTIGGEKISYTATAGMLPQLDDKLKPKGNIFYIAYTKDGAKAEDRPILFSFNGGPGSSSVWLHMGTLGPKRVAMGPEGEAPPLPTRIVENEYSWLDVADLVFIDPMSTGFSRAVEGEDAKQFHGLNEDISSVAKFIRLYITRNARWASPKFLIGESYGGTRGAGLAGFLQSAMGISLNGVILVSPAVDFSTLRFDDNNDLPYVLFLPTYTATAWHHKKLPADLQGKSFDEVLREAETFASGEYQAALLQGARLDPARREAVATELARLTGLSKDYVLRADLRVKIFNFTKELLRGEGRTVGRFDSRYKGIDRDGVGASVDYDPSYAVVQGAYTSAINAYLRGELKYESDDSYEILTGVGPWKFPEGSYPSTSDALRSAMTQNPSLKVLFTGGYYDLAVPYASIKHVSAHLGLDPTLRGNVSEKFYRAGHMYYLRAEDLKQSKVDGAAFIKSAVGTR